MPAAGRRPAAGMLHGQLCARKKDGLPAEACRSRFGASGVIRAGFAGAREAGIYGSAGAARIRTSQGTTARMREATLPRMTFNTPVRRSVPPITKPTSLSMAEAARGCGLAKLRNDEDILRGVRPQNRAQGLPALEKALHTELGQLARLVLRQICVSRAVRMESMNSGFRKQPVAASRVLVEFFERSVAKTISPPVSTGGHRPVKSPLRSGRPDRSTGAPRRPSAAFLAGRQHGQRAC